MTSIKKVRSNAKKAGFILKTEAVFLIALSCHKAHWWWLKKQIFHMLIWHNFGCLKTYFKNILHSSQLAHVKVLAKVTIICFMINIFSSFIIIASSIIVEKLLK